MSYITTLPVFTKKYFYRVKEIANEKALNNYDALYKDMQKLTSLLKINIISKLLPHLNKPGYEDTPPQYAFRQQLSTMLIMLL